MTTQKSQKISDIQTVQRMQRFEQISHADISRQRWRWGMEEQRGWLGEHRMSDSSKMSAEQWRLQPSSLWGKSSNFPEKLPAEAAFQEWEHQWLKVTFAGK